jgi:MFS family permease
LEHTPRSSPDPASAAAQPVPPQRWLTSGVAGVGAASLFSDAGHEMTTSLLPSFLTATLHAGPAALGTIDGISDALVGLSKLAGGPLANDPQRRGRLASGGYLGTALATGLIGAATAAWQVGLLRAAAWISRGLRAPARDALLTSIAPPHAYGRAFGFERAGDNAGAILGPLLAAALVGAIGIRHTLLLAIVPGLLAAASITLAARHARAALTAPSGRRILQFNLAALRKAGLARVLTPVALFELGNLATTLLILRATDLLHTDGRSLTAATSLAILLYTGHNAAAAATALLGGYLADRFSARRIFAAGAAAYLIGYALFAITEHQWPMLLAGFALAGAGIGFAETAEATTVAQQLPDHLRGSGFGLLGLVQSLGDLGATVLAGILWAVFTPTIAFTYAAAWMGLSLLTTGLLKATHPVAHQ